eukprot:gene5277-5812_t
MLSPWGISSIEERKLRQLRVPISRFERDRLRVIRESHLLNKNFDTTVLDRLATMCCISIVEVDKIYAISHIALDSGPFSRDLGFCSHSVLDDAPSVLVVGDATKDQRFTDNVFVKSGCIMSYVGAVVTISGRKIGTLCVFYPYAVTDLRPRERDLIADLALTVSEVLTFYHERILFDQRALARLLVGTFHPLNRPIIQAKAQESLLRRDYKEACQMKQAQAYYLLGPSCETFKRLVEGLEGKIELSLDLAGRYLQALQRYSSPAPLSSPSNVACLYDGMSSAMLWGRDVLQVLQEAVCAFVGVKLSWEMDPKLSTSFLTHLELSLLILVLKSLLWIEEAEIGDKSIYVLIVCQLAAATGQEVEGVLPGGRVANSIPSYFSLHVISSTLPVAATSFPSNPWHGPAGGSSISSTFGFSSLSEDPGRGADRQVVRLAQEDLCRSVLHAKQGGLEPRPPVHDLSHHLLEKSSPRGERPSDHDVEEEDRYWSKLTPASLAGKYSQSVQKKEKESLFWMKRSSEMMAKSRSLIIVMLFFVTGGCGYLLRGVLSVWQRLLYSHGRSDDETVMFLVEMMADAPWTLIDCFFYFSTLQGPSDNPFFRCSLMFIWFHRSSVQSKLYALV